MVLNNADFSKRMQVTERIFRTNDMIAKYSDSVGHFRFSRGSQWIVLWPFSSQLFTRLVARVFFYGRKVLCVPFMNCWTNEKEKEANDFGNDLVGVSGIICWNCRAPEEPPESGTGQTYLARMERLFVCSMFSDTPECNESIVSYLRIPRDILQIYRDKDPDCLRKLELNHSVRIFWGRDFERFRDRDKASAPRGLTRMCFCGQRTDVSDARLEVFKWIHSQGDFCEEEILVPEFAAGNVIGRQGTRVAQMQLESRAKIDVMSRDAKGSDVVKIFVSGRRPARNHAKRLIQNCVEHSERMRQDDEIRANIRDVRRRILYPDSDEEDDAEPRFPLVSYEPFKQESFNEEDQWEQNGSNESDQNYKDQEYQQPTHSTVGEVCTEAWD